MNLKFFLLCQRVEIYSTEIYASNIKEAINHMTILLMIIFTHCGFFIFTNYKEVTNS
ncbi:hypothetical protein XBKQ1_1360003 [Xenorhabdus bovienii str. kraussei Quebec]|uniref:Uncharacterized protein n=1 Tax=Xenorhabdus bovienii str. kraussei Quebec TaxID=1398203 RepID=A0A077PFV1_XENBV|nr:hypothetical protein XBKQ1_1360003 [Xenorhabdus bovienii str. kraussei Quebec]